MTSPLEIIRHVENVHSSDKINTVKVVFNQIIYEKRHCYNNEKYVGHQADYHSSV